MWFKLMTSGRLYWRSEYERLKTLGFKFCDEPERWGKYTTIEMDTSYDPRIEFHTLDELMAFVDEWNRVVLTSDTIEIYDDDRE